MFGFGVLTFFGVKPSWDLWCGLYFNIERLRMVGSLETLQGVSASKKQGALNKSWFDAASLIDIQAKAMATETNLDRIHAAGMRKGLR